MKKNCPCKRKDIVREGKKMKGKKKNMCTWAFMLCWEFLINLIKY